MRQVLFALVVLSILASAQNVLALSPAPLDLANAAPVATEAAGVPPVGSLALLFTGLVGLSAAGRRFEGRSEA